LGKKNLIFFVRVQLGEGKKKKNGVKFRIIFTVKEDSRLKSVRGRKERLGITDRADERFHLI